MNVVAIGWVEGVGYAASLLVAGSLMMSNVKHLRWVNLAGSLAFTAYGALLHAWPVFGVNLFCSLIDVYYLDRMARQQDFFTLLAVESDSRFVNRFLRFHEREIARFFPGVSVEQAGKLKGYFILRNMLPAGLFLYEEQPDGLVEVKLDYAIPEYRDRKNAEFIYRILNEQFSREGRRAFVMSSRVKQHQQYLRRVGFDPEDEQGERFRRAII